MAAPQSVNLGLRRAKGLVLVKQWATLLAEGEGEEEEEEEEETLVGGVVDVRFTGWWMGERSDVGGTARERAVEAITVSRERIRHRIIIVHNFGGRRTETIAFWESTLRHKMPMRVLSHMAEPSLAWSKAHHACLSCHAEDPHARELLHYRDICGVRYTDAPHGHIEIIRGATNIRGTTHGILDTNDTLCHDLMRSVCYINHPEGVCPGHVGVLDKYGALAKYPLLVSW